MNIQDISKGLLSSVSSIIERKSVKEVDEPTAKGEKDFTPHTMYDPKTGKAFEAKTYEDHVRMDKMGYTPDDPNVKEVDEPTAKGEKDFKDLHTKNVDVHEATAPDKELASWLRKRLDKGLPGDRDLQKELEKLLKKLEEGADKDVKGDKEAYQKFFQGMLKKFGVKSPSELSGDKEKEFYDAIDAGWKADDEKKEETLEESPTNALYRTTKIHLALRNAGLKPNDAKKVTDALKLIYGGSGDYKGSEVSTAVRAVIGDDSKGRKTADTTIAQLHDLSQTPSQKKGFNEETLEERVRSMDPKKKFEIFNELKKGDKLGVAYDSPMADAGKRDGQLIFKEFTVTRNKTVVGKARVEKITLAKDGRPGGVKFFLYNRKGDVQMAIGDMAVVIVDMHKLENESTNESISESVIEDLKDIVRNKQMQKIQGVKVDLTTASTIVRIYDKVNANTKAIMDKANINRLIDAAFLTKQVMFGKK